MYVRCTWAGGSRVESRRRGGVVRRPKQDARGKDDVELEPSQQVVRVGDADHPPSPTYLWGHTPLALYRLTAYQYGVHNVT